MGYWLHLVFPLLDFLYKLNVSSTALNAMIQSGGTGYDWKQDMQSETPTSALLAYAEPQPDAVIGTPPLYPYEMHTLALLLRCRKMCRTPAGVPQPCRALSPLASYICYI